MNLHQDFKMVKQVLIEQQWMFDKILYFIKHPSLFYQCLFHQLGLEGSLKPCNIDIPS